MYTELHEIDIPGIFSRFSSVLGDQHWRTRTRLVREDMRGNPILRAYLQDKNELALGFDTLSEMVKKYGQLPTNVIQSPALRECLAFAAQFLSLHDELAHAKRNDLIRRVHGGLKNPSDLRALQFEFQVAVHFSKKGYSVQWPEYYGTGTFDLFVPKLGALGLEIECKWISEDKGRKIHRREILEFWGLLTRELKDISNALKIGMAIVLTLRDSLPTSHIERKTLARSIKLALVSGKQNSELEGASLRVIQFDPRILDQLDLTGGRPIPRELADDLTKTKNREVMLAGRRNSGALMFAVQSNEDDNLLKRIFDSLSDAAQRQLTKERPGLLFAGLHGIDANELLSLAKQDFDASQGPTALRVGASNFLSNPDRDHVVGVGFLSRGRTEIARGSESNSGGTAYIFPRRESRLWQEEFSGLFGSLPV